MKKALVKLAAKSRAEMLEGFQPLYLLVSLDLEPQKYIFRLEKIEEEIQTIIKPDLSESVKMDNKKIQSLFFNDVIKLNPTQCVEIGLKNPYSLNLA